MTLIYQGLAHGMCNRANYTVSRNPIIISSHGFPDSSYYRNTDDCWSFASFDNSRLKITFKEFSTESGQDEVDVYDGSSSIALVMYSFSGTISSSSINALDTTGPFMFVHFSTDGSINERGWQACVCNTQYPCDCDWIIVTDWEEAKVDLDDDLGLTLWISIGVGITALLSLPLIIGLSIACCACCATHSRRHTTTHNTAIVMETIDISNLPRGVYPTQLGVGYTTQPAGVSPTQPSGVYPTQQGVTYAQTEPCLQPSVMSPPDDNPQYPQVVAPGCTTDAQPGSGSVNQGYAETNGVEVKMTQPPDYTSANSPPVYQP